MDLESMVYQYVNLILNIKAMVLKDFYQNTIAKK